MTEAKQPPARRTGVGEYEYRGHRIFDNGAGRSGYNRRERDAGRWVIRERTGAGAFDSRPAGRARTLRDAKAAVDAAIAKATGGSHV